MIKSTIIKELDEQDKINGVSSDTVNLRKFLDCCQWITQWQVFTKVKLVSTGPMSYEYRKEWYMTDELKKLFGLISNTGNK